MSHSRKPSSELGLDSLSNRFRNTLICDNNTNKPDFRELDLGSPVSPLRTRHSGPSGLTTSSSSSSGSVSGRRRSDSGGLSHSSELSGSVESSKPRSDPLTHPGLGSVNSPALNVLPAGNICPSGKILKTVMAGRSSKTDVLGSGTGNYGHGSVMRGGAAAKTGGEGVVCGGDPARRASVDPEEVKRAGNEQYKLGNVAEALRLYDRAISMSPENAVFRFNKAVALTGLRRLAAAVSEYEAAIRLDPGYVKANQRLGSLLLRLGQVENARRHICFPGQDPDANELLRLQALETHLSKCTDARKIRDWRRVLREVDAAVATGADACPQLNMCKSEALLKLHQLEDANANLSNISKFEQCAPSCLQSKCFGMLLEAYLFFVRAQIEMAFGRFENAVTAAEKAGQIDPRNIEVSVLLNNVRLVSKARARGNDLFKSERFTEACSAYGEGLKLDPSNSVLYCNRAACWFKLGLWEHSVDDCNQALHIQPKYTKALLRRAASNSKLERWAEAVRDYEVLRRDLPHDNEVAKSLFHAQVALKKSRGDEVHNMKFGGEVELVLDLEQFKSAISSPGASVVHFTAVSNLQSKQISPFLDTLHRRYPSINFLKVDVEESPGLAIAENVRMIPAFKIYKNGSRVKELVRPSPDLLESSVRHYSL
ncbi:TPR repeat-containing thioredoxin like [Actinidia chinensis var. chinensis]|uniref:TPR repeat-containing thioredoxin like n=1 Tax=Actinidia chinensis var. chinensis TaxID=1590841 RepID=A0A2R6QCJ8_ACTCC|nr:TPR repeat-containing thioredoxin like [Actinidia chinensis var. chinensis]